MTMIADGGPVTSTVLFTVTVRAFKRDDHWMARTVETGIIAYGDTQEEAERLAGDANVAIIRSWKSRGEDELVRFLTERGIKYSLDNQWGHEPVGDFRNLAA